MEFGWYADLDVSGAVEHVAGRPEVGDDRIGALGPSMGGEEVIGAAAADPRLRAVVAEGRHQPRRRRQGVAVRRVRRAGRGPGAGRAAGPRRHRPADRRRPAPRTLREPVALVAPRPVLLVTAGDVPDEGHAARSIRPGAPTTVEVWTVPGAGHTDGLDTAPTSGSARVVGFLDRSLGGSSTARSGFLDRSLAPGGARS